MNTTVIRVISGAGGVDAEALTKILLDMYEGWSHLSGFKHTRVDNKIEIDGDHRQELIGQCGVHRLVRLSPFDELHRRHTSFNLVEIDGMGDFFKNTQVISYILHPYKQAKSHILSIETEWVDDVLNGRIELLREYN